MASVEAAHVFDHSKELETCVVARFISWLSHPLRTGVLDELLEIKSLVKLYRCVYFAAHAVVASAELEALEVDD